ncbi:BTAD domain-containing putative transcriptional regulator [Nonomuraea fuscirosea]|uniref:BTAD domain-containing putative transcriptional regulator n=1 Tax=Nonomuraea fuscirosea TaxID=1291556 RepID=UPI0033EDD9B3
MYFAYLGPLAVTTSDGRPVAIAEAKVRALLADLLVHAGRPVAADRLVDDLWGERLPGDPSGALQTKVSRLRGALGRAEPGAEALVVSQAPGYALRAGPDDVDAGRFAQLTAAAYASDDPRARADLLADALTLWRGEAFADLADAEFVAAAATRLREQRLIALETLAEARLELGRHFDLLGELGELVALHPLRERLRAVQLRALYQAGRQAEALAAYAELRERLADELGADPGPELTALHQAILVHDPALSPTRPPATTPARATPAPLAELVGRDMAVAAVRELLAGNRLVTLTGLGGVGKTRLAEEVARREEGDGRLGEVRIVGLTSAVGAEEQVSAVLGVREDAAVRLEDLLRSRRLLLVLDNCEPVIDSAADLVRRLLRAAPDLRVLATSREPLGLAGEAVWTVPPLSQDDAELLFTTRAQALATGAALDPQSVASICRRLDRVPLALELAATRVRAFGVRGVAARLDDRFRLLATGPRALPPRQRSLRAVIDWSWDLLGGDDRRVLRRLAVFSGGCTPAAAEAVAGPDLDVLDPLVRLVDHSLVTVTDGPRYHLPESVGAYALERLAEAGETELIEIRHGAYYAGLAERADLRGPEQSLQLTVLDQEVPNLRAALQRAMRRADATGATRLVLSLTWYWLLRGRFTEARRWLEETLASAGGVPAELRDAAAVWHAGFTLLTGGEAPAAAPESDDAQATWFLGYALFTSGKDLAGSEESMARAMARFQATGDRWGVAATRAVQTRQAFMRGDLETARESGDSAHTLFEELDDRWGLLQTTYPLAALAEASGDYERAARLHRDGHRLAEELGFWTETADRLTGLGRIALLNGDFQAAQELHGQAMQMAAEHGYAAGEIHAEIGLALGARREGSLDEAEACLRRLLAWHRARDFDPGPALLLAELGFVAERRGDARTALELHREGLEVARSGGDPRARALALEGLAGAYALAGEPARAARLLGTAARLRESTGAPMPPAERGDVDRITARIRSVLDGEAFATEFATDALDGDGELDAETGRTR